MFVWKKGGGGSLAQPGLPSSPPPDATCLSGSEKKKLNLKKSLNDLDNWVSVFFGVTACSTSCPDGYYMTHQCSAHQDLVCRGIFYITGTLTISVESIKIKFTNSQLYTTHNISNIWCFNFCIGWWGSEVVTSSLWYMIYWMVS